MSINISTEDLARAEALVAKGHYDSVSHVFQAGLSALECQDFEWTPELQTWIDKAASAERQGQFASAEDVDALFIKYGVTRA